MPRVTLQVPEEARAAVTEVLAGLPLPSETTVQVLGNGAEVTVNGPNYRQAEAALKVVRRTLAKRQIEATRWQGPEPPQPATRTKKEASSSHRGSNQPSAYLQEQAASDKRVTFMRTLLPTEPLPVPQDAQATARRVILIEMLARLSEISVRDVQETFGISSAMARLILKELCRNGYLKEVTRNPVIKWQPTRQTDIPTSGKIQAWNESQERIRLMKELLANHPSPIEGLKSAERRAVLISTLRCLSEITSREVAAVFGVHRLVAYKDLEELDRAGYLKRGGALNSLIRYEICTENLPPST